MTAILIVSVVDGDSVPLDHFYGFHAPLVLYCAFAPGCLYLLSTEDCPQATGTTLLILMESQECLEVYVPWDGP